MAQADMTVWKGRTDPADGPKALRWHQMVKPHVSKAAGIALLGFACDEGVRRVGGRVGAKKGPRAIRQALANLAWPRGQTPVFDAGDITCPDGGLDRAHAEQTQAVAELLNHGSRVFVLGGGHEAAWGSYSGLAAAADAAVKVGVINVDAHLDLRSDWPPTSGTSFNHIAEWCRENGREFHYLCLGASEAANTGALFDRAEQLGADWRLDTQLAPWALAETLAAVDKFIAGVDLVHLSIDLDVLPAAVMPAVSAPAARGVPLESVEAIVSHVFHRTNQVAVVDLVELNPAFDPDGRGAAVAARLAWQIAREWFSFKPPQA
jgi:formiminoglutamase